MNTAVLEAPSEYHPGQTLGFARQRVAVAGPGGALLAIAMRDYGRHAVIGWHLSGLMDPEATKSWERDPIAEAPEIMAVARWADVVLWTSTLFPAGLLASCWQINRWPTLVLTAPDDGYAFPVLTAVPLPMGFAYLPLEPTHQLDRLCTPDELVVHTDYQRVWEQVERLWRPIVNTVPIRWPGRGSLGVLLATRSASRPIPDPQVTPASTERP